MTNYHLQWLKTIKLLQIADENRIEQCFAAHIVHSYQQY